MVFGGGAEDLKGRKANLENDKYLNDEFGGDEFDEKNPNNILKINGMEEENGANGSALTDKRDPFGSTNNFTVQKINGNPDNNKNKFFQLATTTGGNEAVNNPFVNENDLVDIHTNKKYGTKNVPIDPNNLPDKLEDPDDDYNKRLEAFANLNLGFCQFIGENLKERNILVACLRAIGEFLNQVRNYRCLWP